MTGPPQIEYVALKLSCNHLQKILEKLRKLRKSCSHMQNIIIMYNEKLHYNCLQQLPTLRLKTFKT